MGNFNIEIVDDPNVDWTAGEPDSKIVMSGGDGEGGGLLSGMDADGNSDDDKSKTVDKDKDGEQENVTPNDPGATSNKPDTTPVVKDGIDYKSVLEKMSKVGVINDITSAEFDIDGTKIGFSELSFSTEDDFIDFVRQMVDARTKDILDNKIDASGVSDFTKKLIEADKNGVNVSQIVKQYERYQAPIDVLDVNEKKDQLKIIWHYLSNINIDESEAKDLYDAIVAKGDEEIATRASKYKRVIEDKMSKMIEEKNKEALEEKQRKEESMKTYRKSFRENAQKSFQLNDRHVQKLVDYVTKPIGKPDASGARNEITEAFISQMSNPETAVEVAMFFMNRDEYKKQIASNHVNSATKRIYNVISSSKRAGGPPPIDDDGNKNKNGFGDDLEEIKIN